MIYLPTIKTKLTINFSKKNFCTWTKIGLALKGLIKHEIIGIWIAITYLDFMPFTSVLSYTVLNIPQKLIIIDILIFYMSKDMQRLLFYFLYKRTKPTSDL